jgi:LPXTG-site transpeptidase (sortase) family protein
MFDQPRSPGTRILFADIIIWSGFLLVLIGGLLVGPGLEPFVASRLHSGAPSTPPPPSATAIPLAQVVLPLFEPDAQAVPTATAAWPQTPTPPGLPTAVPTPAQVGLPPTRIIIPDIRLDAPVVPANREPLGAGGTQQTTWSVPAARASGWHEGSAPLGVPGNTVLNGHNTTQGEVFRDLYQLEPGDKILLLSAETLFVYEVTERLILPELGQPLEVRSANAQTIQATQDERVTLVTCHPYNSLEFRLVIIARPVDPGPQ